MAAAREDDVVVDPVPAPPAFGAAEMLDSQTWNEEVEDSTQDEEP
jgi:hypothetical protein